MPVPFEVLPSFLFYCYISAVTPGPANICSLSTSLSQGKKAAFQQWLGIFSGFFVVSMMAVFVSYFLGNALNDKVRYLSFVGAAYLLYLAIHILRENFKQSENSDERKLGDIADSDYRVKPDNDSFQTGLFFRHFITGLLVQLTNVKIMLMCLTVLASYVLPYHREFFPIFAVGVFLPFTGPVANLLWLFVGLSLQKLFANHKKVVNVVMSLSLVLCAMSLVGAFFK